MKPYRLKINPSLFIAKFFLPAVFVLHSFTMQAQEKVENALLWKVTGNSLLKPSFLFGTIHLQDKRVFNFSDSLYSFLRHADGFAMEIHPDSVIAAVMKNQDEKAKETLLKRHLKKGDYEMLSRKLKKDFGIDAGKLTVHDAYLLKEHLAKPEPRKDDMPTFVDAYLFGIARNQGKEIAGLEKADDQMLMLDEIQGELDVRAIVNGMKKEKEFLEQLVQLYIKEDLQAISKLMSYLPEETEDKLLTRRNHVMAARMDSLIKLKSFVVAVGTAHLPGKEGIIELLRKKGYTVEPVFTTSRTHATQYAVKAGQNAQWVDVKEPRLGYSVRMPAKPSPMDMLNGATKMNMYLDLTSMRLYYSAFGTPGAPITAQNADVELKAMAERVMKTSEGKPISSKRFKKDGFEGIDIVYKELTANMFVRLQVMAMGQRMYLVCFGAPKLEEQESEDAKTFFASFKIENMPLQSWQVHTFKNHYFSISLPDEPKVAPIEHTDSSVYSVQVTSIDNSKGTYYGLTIVTAAPGYLIPDDSVYFANTVARLEDKLEMLNIQETDTSFQGFNAKWVEARLRDNLMLHAFLVSRGGRVYTVFTVSNRDQLNELELQSFFDSFKFVDYPPLQWKQKKDEQLGFAAPEAGQFTQLKFLDELEDSAASTRQFISTMYDSASAVSFFVTRRKISPYLWVKHDSVLLLNYMKELTDPDEQVTDHRFVRNGGSNGLEFNIRRKNSKLQQRMRLLLNGEGIYVLQADAPDAYWKQYNYGRLMEEFRFAKEVQPSFLYTNSLNKFVEALRSTDSLTQMQAYDALDRVLIDSSELQQVLAAACQVYPVDTTGLIYETVGKKLLGLAAAIKYSKFNELVEAQYHSLKPEQEEFKYELLTTLAFNRDVQSIALIKKLLTEGLPSKGNPVEFVNALQDSLQLAKGLYPWIISQTGDTLLGTSLFMLHKQMTDSNHISLGEFKPYHRQLLQAARNELAVITKNKSDYYFSTGIIELTGMLGSLGTDSATALLYRFLDTRFVNIKYHAAVALLEAGKTVSPAALLALAADTSSRIALYEELKELKKEKLFPAKYLSRRAFAESYLYHALDYSPLRTIFIGEKTAMYKGRKQKFLLYRLVFEEEAGEVSYLGVCGAYGLDDKSVLTTENISGMYTGEYYHESAVIVDKLLKAYIALYEQEE